MARMKMEMMAFFAFSFVILFTGGPCGALGKLTGGANESVPAANYSTHYSCVAGACSLVAGAGTNECSADSDCAAVAPPATGNGTGGGTTAPPATHLACIGSSCTTVQGAGANTCSSDSDCAAPTGNQSGGQGGVSPPSSGTDCSKYTDCSACLKTVPNECKWCIQGSICAGVNDNTQSCTFGPTAEKWLTKDYQCVLATR